MQRKKCNVINMWLCIQWVRLISIKPSHLKIEHALSSIPCAVSGQSIPPILADCVKKEKKLAWFWMETFKYTETSFRIRQRGSGEILKFSVILKPKHYYNRNLAKYKNGTKTNEHDTKKQLNTCSLSSL